MRSSPLCAQALGFEAESDEVAAAPPAAEKERRGGLETKQAEKGEGKSGRRGRR